MVRICIYWMMSLIGLGTLPFLTVAQIPPGEMNPYPPFTNSTQPNPNPVSIQTDPYLIPLHSFEGYIWDSIISVSFHKVPLSKVLLELVETYSLPLSFGGEAAYWNVKVSLAEQQTSVERIIRKLCKQLRLDWRKVGNYLILYPPSLHESANRKITISLQDASSKNVIAGALIRSLGNRSPSVITRAGGQAAWKMIDEQNDTLIISHIAYKKDTVILSADSGDFLKLELFPEQLTFPEVLITNLSLSNTSSPPFSSVSVIRLHPQSSKKFAGQFQDVGRMAMVHAGITHEEDITNELVIRGNSPKGIQWRVAGINLLNPNHFAEIGAGGGGVHAISSQMIEEIDVYTGAFPAPFGNALSGVFDMKFRKGQTDRMHNRIGIGTLMTEWTLEGPLSKKRRASYLVNVRAASFRLLQEMGIFSLGEIEPPSFQDIAYHFYIPTYKWGSFSVWGFGGNSMQQKGNSQAFTPELDGTSHNWQYEGYHQVGSWGMQHQVAQGNRTLLSTTLAHSIQSVRFQEDSLTQVADIHTVAFNNFQLSRLTLASTLDHYPNEHLHFQTGITLNRQRYDLYANVVDFNRREEVEWIDQLGTQFDFQGYFQAQYDVNDQIQFIPGVHISHSGINRETVWEPRLGMNWRIDSSHSIHLGLGKYSQAAPLTQRFVRVYDENGQYTLPNAQLRNPNAIHVVLGYQYLFSPSWQLSVESYYQHLYHIHVAKDVSLARSTLNISDGYLFAPNFGVVELIEKGYGRNYGLDISMNGQLNSQYILATLSLYRSKFGVGDGFLWNSRFNGRIGGNIAVGKTINWRNHRLDINLRWVFQGGQHFTPVDVSASQYSGRAVLEPARLYSEQIPLYMRLDGSIQWKWGIKGVKQALSVEIQNVTDRENMLSLGGYNEHQERVFYRFHAGMLPVLSYEVRF